MAWVDWLIAFLMLMSVLAGVRNGFLRSASALIGLVMGLSLATWNYERLGRSLVALVRSEALANTLAFLLIAFLVMVLAAIIGKILSKAVHGVGLGCLDRLAGAVFGFFQGALVVMIFVLTALAFYPHASWLAEARLPRLFFGACHQTARVSPNELANRVRSGLRVLAGESPQWMHPGKGGL